jgi:hypothetical protein
VTVAPKAQPQTSGKAIAALILGICGIVVFPLIGVVALFVGYGAREEIRREPGLAGDGMATAGIVLGWVSVAIVILGILLLIAIF